MRSFIDKPVLAGLGVASRLSDRSVPDRGFLVACRPPTGVGCVLFSDRGASADAVVLGVAVDRGDPAFRFSNGVDGGLGKSHAGKDAAK